MSKNKVWEHYGEKNAYYGVYTEEKFRDENLDDENLNEFFDSGKIYLQKIWDEIENHFIPNFQPSKALDFGCGVGRLTIPMGKKCKSVLGVDISSTMLKEAEVNAAKRNATNVKFKQANEQLSNLNEEFDFVHSFIVFQHINPKDGEIIFENIVKMLKPDGIGVLHLTYSSSLKGKHKITNTLYQNFPFIHSFRNIILRADKEPFIPMHNYNLNNIFKTLQDNGCHKSYLRYTFHGFDGLVIFFQKQEGLL